MGYYTNYELEHDASSGEADKIEKYIEQNDNMSYAIGSGEACKWYRWKEDMEVMSREFPEVSFTLEGHGEEYGDIWRAFIKDGTTQKRKATITF